MIEEKYFYFSKLRKLKIFVKKNPDNNLIQSISKLFMKLIKTLFYFLKNLKYKNYVFLFKILQF
jgi:hypothetical protein